MLLGGILLAVFNFWLRDISPDIVVRHYLETVETGRPVPARIGALDLDYRMPSAAREAVYKVEVANEGRGPEEDLRVQVGFNGVELRLYEDPQLKIFNPVSGPKVDKNGYFMRLGSFPKNALTTVTFEAPADYGLLCGVTIEAAGKENMGRVEGIRGVKCE